ncbi:HvfC/BufC N-terminal domain-containing protein [Burkholderia plantarii]|uniref:HvfC/BufC N-terminal domain-containing protein n=1 Tax=Burkholderia plantarii TaxID=41899 RepID=UPI0018DE81DF|nr:DNA-binding domain-containing protein [Burkholderia plantarii]MBI0326452.1 putative DNA-binding domain-containing protein [Burkholderia plantarii]
MTRDQLARLQAAFGAQLARRDAALETLAPWLDDDDATRRRFARYQASLRHGHARSLQLVYPVLHALVGEAFFRTLAHAYGDAHPSRDGDLSRFGAELARFVADLPAAAGYPYFADVARLEWSLHAANHAADAPPLRAAELAAAGVDAARDWPLALHPAAALHASPWRVAAIWFAHRRPDGPTLPASIDGPGRALVYRDGWTPTVRELEAPEWAALGALARGATLGEALAAGLTAAPDMAAEAGTTDLPGEPPSPPSPSPPFDPAAALRRWLADGLLARPARP